MEKYLNKFYDIIDKIGKQNFMLIVFIIIVVVITGIYQTFSLYTEMSAPTLVDGIKTYQFVLNANNTTNTINIPKNSSKNIDITINNDSNAKLLYGLYYSSTNEEVNIGYLPRSAALPRSADFSDAIIEAKTDNIVTLRVSNQTDSDSMITFGVKYGFINGGDLVLDEKTSWLEEYDDRPNDKILANHIINLYNDGSAINTVHIGDDTSNPQVSLNETQQIMLDNNGEYRYYGSKPNNYVRFNNESWRIISSSNVKSSTTDTKGEQRIKLIKSGEIVDDNGTDTFFFSGAVNDYSQAEIKDMLNTIYLNASVGDCVGHNTPSCNFSTTGLNGEARGLIDNAVYYLGGIDGTSYYNYYADDYYKMEREGNVYDASSATNWTGKVGLLYLSDWAYSELDFKGGGFNWPLDNVKKFSWIYTLTPNLSSSDRVFSVANGVNIDTVPTYTIVLPTVYLKSNVKWVSGDGTSENPYILDGGQ